MLVTITVTCRNKIEADKIALAFLKKKLVACANIWPVDSYYWWQGKIATAKETMLVVKTLAKNVTKTKKVILALHSYKTPCLSIEKIDTNPACLSWVKSVIK